MTSWVDVGMWASAAAVSLPWCVVATESWLAALGGPEKACAHLHTRRPRAAVLVPAHNESDGIVPTIRQLVPQLGPGDRLVVIADNCQDTTAAVARAHGAEVIERHDPTRRGKGYALAFGIDYLRADPPEVVLVVDADCHVLPQTVDQLARAAAWHQSPVQGLDLLDPPADATLRDRVSSFACTMKNLVRPLGLSRLGLPCMLMGTGLAIPWPLIERAELASGHITEDMQLGVDLAIAGATTRMCLAGGVRGELPSGGKAARAQRTRWEHGHLATLTGHVPRLLLASARQNRPELASLALELMVPPLALLASATLLIMAVLAGATLAGASSGPLAMVVGVVLFAALAVLLAWWRFGRDVLRPADLVAIPHYIVSKLPIYWSFVVRPQRAGTPTCSPLPHWPDNACRRRCFGDSLTWRARRTTCSSSTQAFQHYRLMRWPHAPRLTRPSSSCPG